jgi:stage II sporulation SpoAA-like protein
MFKVKRTGTNRLDLELSGKNWIKIISEFEGMLIPGLEIKAFSRDQKEAAEAWLSDRKQKTT